MVVLRTLLVVAMLQGCAHRGGALEQDPARGAPTVACPGAATLPEPLPEPGSVLLFGEIHGSQELPAVFGDAVCSTASTRLPVQVGLEIPREDQASLDSFLASPGAPADVAALIATEFWTRDFQDGRSRQAMVALLERLRQLRARGLPIQVFAFDLDASHKGAERDRGMAEKLSARARAHPEALTMALTGEVHAWKTQGAPWNPNLLPMGWQLAQGGLQLYSLGRSTPTGRVWVCVGGLPSDCGPRETQATGVLPSGRTAGVELLQQPSARGYDGLYGTPSLTASPPARSSRDPQAGE